MFYKTHHHIFAIVITFMLSLSHTAHSADVQTIINELKAGMPNTISQSYKAIPHGQTTFSSTQSPSSGAEKIYFDHFFTLTDLMMSARVSALTNLYHGRGGITVSRYNAAYNLAMNGFSQLKVPSNASKAQELILTAIKEHRAFLNKWNSAKGGAKDKIKNSYRNDPLVRSSSRKLIQAYGVLMSRYSSETGHNKKAFYDHLCALDFI